MQNSLAIQIRTDICSQPEYREFISTTTDHEWKKLTKKSFANVLKGLECKDSNNPLALSELIDPECFLKKLKQQIVSKLTNYKYPQNYIFGCHISNKQLKTIKIGPVLFEHRFNWLDRFKSEKYVKLDIEFIKSKWQGNKPIQNPTDWLVKLQTDRFLQTIDKADYVCTVELNKPISHGIGRYYALNAARLALTTISLGFQTPSKALEHIYLNWDMNSTEQALFQMIDNNGGYESMRQHFPGGIKLLSLENWENLLEGMENKFKSTGEILSWFVNGARDPDSDISQERSIFHALLWYYKGCVEENNQMAIHHFLASLDSLSGQQSAKGIKEKLIEAGLSDQTIVNKISNMYSEVRSLLSHGKYDKLEQIYYDDRVYAEIGAKLSLIHALDDFHDC